MDRMAGATGFTLAAPAAAEGAASRADVSEDELLSAIHAHDLFDTHLDSRSQAAAAEDEDDLSTIKAKTMFKMVEEIPGTTGSGARKLLFLSGKQAELIADSPQSIDRLLDIGFEVPPPRLVIQFSPSLSMSAQGMDAKFYQEMDLCASNAELDRFMLEVIIPLAAQTNALILCSGVLGYGPSCGLAGSLTRVMSVVRSRWGGRPPFTVISGYGEPGFLYLNRKPDAAWRSIRSASKPWRQREPKLIELLSDRIQECRKETLDFNPLTFQISSPHQPDLDPNASNLLIVDTSSDSKLCPPGHKRTYNLLIAAIFRHLGSEVPAITLKTGMVGFSGIHQKAFSGIEVLVDAVHSGSPVLLLDCRSRPRPKAAVADQDDGREASVGQSKRAALIQWARDEMQRELDSNGNRSLVQAAMWFGFWHSILNGSGDPMVLPELLQENRCRERLHRAIERAEAGQAVFRGGMPPASAQQRDEVLRWLGLELRKAQHELDEAQSKESGSGTVDPWEDNLRKHADRESDLNSAFVLRASSLLDSPHLHSVNLREANIDEVKKMVFGLARLDRLPKETPLEGLLLLRQAWDERDIVHHLSERYKLLTKVLFTIQLLITFSIVCVATLANEYEESEAVLKEVAFSLTVAASFLFSLDAFLSPKAKWRQLRTFGGSLESIVWQYRCRVAPFALDKSNPDSAIPEARLREAIIAWRNEMAAGADLHVSALRKEHPPAVFRHGQRPATGAQDPQLPEIGGNKLVDDHFSPAHAADYIELRLRPLVAWYRQRIPSRSRQRMLLKILMLLTTVGTSILARYSLGHWVVMLAGFYSLMTSWAEFGDFGRKIERYNRLIASVENLLSWWESIGPVEKASSANVAHLIDTGESVIATERLAWQSTAGRRRAEGAGVVADAADDAGKGGGRQKEARPDYTRVAPAQLIT